MKHLSAVGFVFAFLVVNGASGKELKLGLKSDEAQRKKDVIFVYFSNDRMAPTGSQLLSQNNHYLYAALEGHQVYLQGEKDGRLTEQQLDFYAKLPEADRKFLKQLGQAANTDASETASASEYRTLLNSIARPNPHYRMGFVIFRNFFQGFKITEQSMFEIEHLPPGEETVTWKSHSVKCSEFAKEALTFPYNEQPVSHVSVIERLLKAVNELYPPENHRYVVVFKSQGAKDRALSPHHDVDIPHAVKYEDLVAELLKRRNDFGDSASLPPKVRGLNGELSGIVREMAGIKERAGTTPADVLRVLSGNPGTFPVVFFDVDQLEINQGDLPKDPANIGSVFYTDKRIPYGYVDYFDLFSFLGVQETDFEDRAVSFLRSTVQ